MHCRPAFAQRLHGSPDVGSMMHFTLSPRQESQARGLLASDGLIPPLEESFRMRRSQIGKRRLTQSLVRMDLQRDQHREERHPHLRNPGRFPGYSLRNDPGIGETA